MGEVYLAKDTRLDRTVALKILPSDAASNQERMRHFTQEAKAAAALNHPNIAHIHEIGEADDTHFIAMEYVDGVMLNEKIHREKGAAHAGFPSGRDGILYGNGGVFMSEQVLEGTWEEIARHGEELAGKRVRLTVLDDSTPQPRPASLTEGRPLSELLEGLVGVIDSQEPFPAPEAPKTLLARVSSPN